MRLFAFDVFGVVGLFVAVWMALSVSAQVGPQAPETAALMRCQAQVYELNAQVLKLNAEFSDGKLGDAAWAVKQFEAANPGKSLDGWKVIDKPADKPAAKPKQ